MRYAGIDPGLDGWLAVIDADGQPVALHKAPTIPTGKGSRRAYDLRAMSSLVSTACLCVTLCVIEQQQAMPSQGSASGFRTGYGYGLWRMALTAAQVPHAEVRPAAWKRAAGLSAGRSAAAKRDHNAATKEAKAKAIAKVQALYPSLSLLPTPRSRVPSADMAEAVLLARYARHKATGVPL